MFFGRVVRRKVLVPRAAPADVEVGVLDAGPGGRLWDDLPVLARGRLCACVADVGCP